MLKCGMHEVNITPSLGNWIPGQFEERHSTGVKDDLFAKSLVIETDSDVMAFIALDALDIAREQVMEIRNRVAAYTTIPADNVMVSATHIHTGGPVIPGLAGSVDSNYLQDLVEKAADAAIIAYQSRTGARVGFGRGHEPDIAFNRRFFMKDGSVETNPGIGNPDIDRPTGPIDPDVLVIRIDDIAGNPIGVVTNYACHTDVVGGTEYSADYPGELSRVLKQTLGDHIVSLFMQGSSGNINHIDVSGKLNSRHPNHYRKMGRILAGEVLKVREKIETSDVLSLGMKQVFFPVSFRHPSDQEIRQAEEVLQSNDDNIVEEAFARQIMKILEDDQTSTEIEVQVAKLGPLAVVGLPAEIFVEFGLAIKEKSPFTFTIINELCNGSAFGYVCTQEAYRQGGYEPRIKHYSRLAEDAGDRFVEEALGLLNKL